MLVRPGHTPLELRQGLGVVGELLWTADGKYLVGAGTNTVRLWNLAGGVRVTTPAGPRVSGQSRQASITALKVNGAKLCVLLREDWYRPGGSGRITQTAWSEVRYALPSFKLLSRRTTPTQSAPFCRDL